MHSPTRAPHESAVSLQRATCTGIRVRSPADARVIFHSVYLNILPIVTRRLDTEERNTITPGSVYVWEERGPHAEATGLGIERWTDGIRWGPSRVRDGFLFYHEKETRHIDAENIYGATPISQMRHEPSRGLIKQTYSVYVDTTSGRKKWHLIAYFTEESLEYLRTVNDLPHLASLLVPQGRYKSARTAKGRIRDQVEDDYTPSSGSQLPPINSPISDTQEKIFTDARRPSLPHPRNEYPRVVSERQSPPTPSTPKDLAPLAYLENIAPRPRHPVDEKLLMMFIPNLH
ncbi:hypothetical protein PC9H_007116 [Pleurotus ostreatus]|uniref:Gti1/Pac2 family-domain-containing protein n=2 Tax=Pleurotus ostreatus TaxID=5322 RepID=A0A8H6ZST3_PLEOS|nr:uncharacterized protein PC9H_007116 [Pleurotus ostreatus]KAF7427899.1 hypothetical protein PC9H_007116 [Pleurotus ostreatus]